MMILRILTVVSLAWPFSAHAQQSYLLRLTDRVGDANRYRLSYDLEMQASYDAPASDQRAHELMEALGEGMAVATSIDYEQQLEAVGPDGTRTFSVRWHDYDFHSSVGGKPIPKPPGHDDARRSLLAATATLRTTPDGRTVDFEYSDPALASLTERFRQMNNSMPTHLPGHPVVVGERWSSQAELPAGASPAGQPLRIRLDLGYTLREVREEPDGPIAVIDISGSYSRLEGGEIPRGGGPMHVRFALKGFTLFDVANGRFTFGQYEMDMLAVQNIGGVDLEVTGFSNGKLELTTVQ